MYNTYVRNYLSNWPKLQLITILFRISFYVHKRKIFELWNVAYKIFNSDRSFILIIISYYATKLIIPVKFHVPTWSILLPQSHTYICMSLCTEELRSDEDRIACFLSTYIHIPYGTKTLQSLNFTVRLLIVWMKNCRDFNFTEVQFRSQSCSDIY